MLLRETCVCGLFGCFFFLVSGTVRAKLIAPSSGQSQMSIPGVCADSTKENNTNDRNSRNSLGWSFARCWLYFLRHQPQDKIALPSSQISHWLHHWLVCTWQQECKEKLSHSDEHPFGFSCWSQSSLLHFQISQAWPHCSLEGAVMSRCCELFCFCSTPQPAVFLALNTALRQKSCGGQTVTLLTSVILLASSLITNYNQLVEERDQSDPRWIA